ncbi:MAG TPA: nucleotidyltransferase family protein [Thermoanaerobaculia bacterium]|nr:nucleotidyltransferase family protein [Thermoanaerobaculia bacterium]
MDFVRTAPVAPRLQQPVRAALRGEASVWPDDLTEDELQALAEHGVAPLIYAAAHVPQLRTEAIRAAAIETLRGADVQAVLAALADAGVEAILMKGTPLAYQIYARPELRPRGDTDLLIAEDALEPTRAAMQTLGFTERPNSGDEHGLRQTTFTRGDAFGVVHAYDVHWAVTNSPVFASVLPFRKVGAAAVDVPQLGPHARALAPVDALLLACVHRVAHHHDSDRLIWLVDIALLRDRMSSDEHRRFWAMAAEGRVVAVCARSIELADAWLSRTPQNGPEQWLTAEELAREEPSRLFLDRDVTEGRVMLANFRALRWTERLRRARQLAFPPPAFMLETFGAQSRAALPWLYVYRAARGIARLFRGVGAR